MLTFLIRWNIADLLGGKKQEAVEREAGPDEDHLDGDPNKASSVSEFYVQR